MLFDFFLKLINDDSFLIDSIGKARALVRDLSRLLLNRQPVLLKFTHLIVLSPQLRLDGLFFQLKRFYLSVELIQFHLLTLNFLVVIGEFLLAFFFFLLASIELLLNVEQIILGFPEVLLCDPALPLLVCLGGHQVLQLHVLVSVHLLHLTVARAKPVHFLLQLLAFVSFRLNRAFHLIDLLLALAYMILHLVHFLIEVGNSALLKVDFTPRLFDFVCKAIDQHVLGFTAILRRLPRLDLNLLVTAILQLKLKQFIALLSIQLLTLPEVSNLNQQLLLVHLTLYIIKHSNRDVVDDFQLFVNLSQHLPFLA